MVPKTRLPQIFKLIVLLQTFHCIKIPLEMKKTKFQNFGGMSQTPVPRKYAPHTL